MFFDASGLCDALSGLPVATGGVLALGNFDGVHVGHRAVIAAAQAKARALGTPPYALTFEPHPYVFFQKEKKPFRLTSVSAKTRLLLEAGAEKVVTLPFSAEMAALSADAFLSRILIELCHVRHVVVGFDFAFGAQRTGNRAFLREKLEPLGIGVTEVPPQCNQAGEIVSSSRIRRALAEGRLGEANDMLGRPYALEGMVQKGDQRGRQLNCPTANVALGDFAQPAYGVYAVAARRQGDALHWPGVANIGVRPTIGGAKALLEFHLFNFSGSLYGELWEVELRRFLRPERKFPDLSALKDQMALDAQEARQALG